MRATSYIRLVTLARERLAAAVAEGRPLAEVYPVGVAVYAYLEHAPEMYPTPPEDRAAFDAAFTGGRRLLVCEGDEEGAWSACEAGAAGARSLAELIAAELRRDFERGAHRGRPVFWCGECGAFGWPGPVALDGGWKRVRRPGKGRLLLCANCR